MNNYLKKQKELEKQEKALQAQKESFHKARLKDLQKLPAKYGVTAAQFLAFFQEAHKLAPVAAPSPAAGKPATPAKAPVKAVAKAPASAKPETQNKPSKKGEDRKPRIIATPAHVAKIEALTKQGKTVAQIVPAVGLSASVVNKIKKRLGLVKQKKK